jgi:hypothetical protein
MGFFLLLVFFVFSASANVVPTQIMDELLNRLLMEQTKHNETVEPPFRFAAQAGLFKSGVHFNVISKNMMFDAAATLIRRKFSIVGQKDFFFFFFPSSFFFFPSA